MDEEGFILPQVFIQHPEGATRFQDVRRRRMVDHGQRVIVGNPHLSAFPPCFLARGFRLNGLALLHRKSQLAQFGHQWSAFRQSQRLCSGIRLREEQMVPFIQQASHLEQGIDSLHFPLQGATDKAGEERGPPLRNFSMSRLFNEQLEIVRGAQQIELRRIPQIVPQGLMIRRAIDLQKLLDLVVRQRFNPNLGNRTFLG